MKSFGNEACFIFVDCAIRVSFDSEYPLTTDRGLGSAWYELPCLVLEKSIVFKVHCSSPGWVLQGLGVGGGFNGVGNWMKRCGIDKVGIIILGIWFGLTTGSGWWRWDVISNGGGGCWWWFGVSGGISGNGY